MIYVIFLLTEHGTLINKIVKFNHENTLAKKKVNLGFSTVKIVNKRFIQKKIAIYE